MDPGAPGLAASARSGCRAGRFNRAVARTRPPSARRSAASPAWRPVPPGGPSRHQPHSRPSSASPPEGRSCGTPEPPRSVTSTRTVPPAARTVTVWPAAPEPLCRMLFPNSSLTSSAASSRHGCPGPSTPAVNARATRARSARPATVTLSRTTALAIRAPVFPARVPGNHPEPPAGHTGMHARLGGPRQVRKRPPARPVRGRPWKSRRCAPTVMGHKSRPLCVRGHRDTAARSATR